MDRRGVALLDDPWLARDAYGDVVVGARTYEDFAAQFVVADGGEDEARTLLEAQRFGLLMYTSCGWFFNDLAGIETVQILRYAARSMDLLPRAGRGAPGRGVPRASWSGPGRTTRPPATGARSGSTRSTAARPLSPA